ncbi:MAG: aconitate hydratase AcnA [Desulfobacterales bacterium]|nr:aconitate hydratase AcnA [Desulfobacterales bacterium]
MDQKKFFRKINVNGVEYTIIDINKLEETGLANIKSLPFSIKILVENLLRKLNNFTVLEKDVLSVAGWKKNYDEAVEIPFHPSRVIMQDFTGVPAVVDLVAMRDAVKELSGDPKKINPLIPVDLIIDHSLQIDFFGTDDSLKKNLDNEYKRNFERYSLLKWAKENFTNFRVIPPNSGICHQINLEHLGKVVLSQKIDNQNFAFPDTVVGTDSHTPMINSIGVVGWGVGGIEAEAVMLGQPYYMSIPEVIGVRLHGNLKEGSTASDAVLTLTELLRKHKVVEKFVEYFGSGLKNLSIPDRSTISNMTPEYGATIGFFPVDEKTIQYLKDTGRDQEAALSEAYAKTIGLFYDGKNEPEYTKVIDFDLSIVEPSIAGPSRPQDRIALNSIKNKFNDMLVCNYKRSSSEAVKFEGESGNVGGESTCTLKTKEEYKININGIDTEISDGSVVIASITSCTNTSNPYGMIGAGIIAKNAVKKGLKVPAYVKTSIAPGSKVVHRYLENSGLFPYLESLGFHVAGLGCATCIGNGGALHPDIETTIKEKGLVVASAISGNRNFEARIHPLVKANYLMSPIYVVAFALAGRIDIDFVSDPIGLTPNGEPVFLKDILPDNDNVNSYIQSNVKKEFYETEYEKIFEGDKFWADIKTPQSDTYNWDKDSMYIKRPPYFENFNIKPECPDNIEGARTLLLLGDSVTTDHISPAGSIPEAYPAGQYLKKQGVLKADFSSYGARRGNHEVMMRGTFANIRIKNKLVAPLEGGYTLKFPDKQQSFIFDASIKYKDENLPLIVLGGKEYGTGSSRDWAAKGTKLLGIKAIIAESFERIHRSNLVGMGVLPLIFVENNTWQTLGLDGSELYYIEGIKDITPRKILTIKAVKEKDYSIDFKVMVRLDTEIEVKYFENGGILPFVLRNLLS